VVGGNLSREKIFGGEDYFGGLTYYVAFGDTFCKMAEMGQKMEGYFLHRLGNFSGELVSLYIL